MTAATKSLSGVSVVNVGFSVTLGAPWVPTVPTWYLYVTYPSVSTSTLITIVVFTGVFTMALIILDTYQNLSPKVYPIIRNN